MNTDQSLLDAPEDALRAADIHPTSQTTQTSVGMSAATISLLGAALLAACNGSDGSGDSASPNPPAPAPAPGLNDQPQAGSGGSGDNASPNPPAPSFNNYPKANSDAEAARFLQQCQFSSNDADISAVRAGDFASYLRQQFAKPIGQTGWDWLEARGYGVSDKYHYYNEAYPADFMIWNQLFTAQDSMRKRIALALSEFFVVSLQTAMYDWRSQAIAQYWDLLVQNAFGNYRQLLEDITLNPAMGYYLNTNGNQKEDGKGRLPDENYGREVMQLFSLGLFQLNIDGTEKIGSDGKKLETYTQDDVSNIARVFTGYELNVPEGRFIKAYKSDGSLEPWVIEPPASVRRRMRLNADKHSTLASTFLGTTIPAGTKGEDALKITLDTLFHHPNVGPFFARQMIQRLVTSNPSPAYIARVASAFNNNGAGVRGDLKAVWTAILLDDEARNPQNINNPNFGKLREPMLRFIQWGRSFGFSSARGSWKIQELSNRDRHLGQSPLRAPSVFNFFRPGFMPPNTALAAQMATAPEFQLVSEIAVGGYLNFMQDTIRFGINIRDAGKPYMQFLVPTQDTLDITPNYVKELAFVNDPSALVNRLNLILCAGQLSVATQKIIVDALSNTPLLPDTAKPVDIQNSKLDRISAAILLMMASPEYLIQK